jgi:hypothetical protein
MAVVGLVLLTPMQAVLMVEMAAWEVEVVARMEVQVQVLVMLEMVALAVAVGQPITTLVGVVREAMVAVRDVDMPPHLAITEMLAVTQLF